MKQLLHRLNDVKIWLRLVVSFLAAILLMWVGFLSWATYQERKIAIDQARDFANSVHQMTMAGLTGMMLTGTIGARVLFLDQIKESNHVESLKVYRSEAVVRQFGPGLENEITTDPIELAVMKTATPYFELLGTGDDERLKAVIPAVGLESYLGKNCLNCHQVAAGTVLGAVSMEISLREANRAVVRFAHSATIAAILLCIPLGLLVWYFGVRLVSHPIEQMTEGLRGIAAGEIENARPLPRRGDDEVGQATQAFNAVLSKASELIHAQKLSRIVFDNALEGITVTDAKGRIRMVNRAFTETTGYAEDEAIGQTPALLKSGKQGEEFYQQFWRTLIDTGEWRGEIWNRRKNGTLYPEWLNVSTVRNGAGEVEHYIAIFSDITERKQREETIAFQAFHDALTGLPNRSLFRDRLDQALTTARRHKYRTPAVMFLDLDRFKQINDTLGHDAGDELLKEVARRLRTCVRESDTVARMGGDEFTVLLPEIAAVEDAEAVGAKILDAMRMPMTLAGQEVFITTSIGVGLFPKDGRDAETLMKHADAAMYHVKGSGRAGICFYTEALTGMPSRRLELEAGLRRALAGSEFVLHYQPVVDLADGRVVAAEALLRWRQAPDILLPPEDFLGIAEESGLIIDIGHWVIDSACAAAAAWRAGGSAGRVAVNLSERQLNHPEIARVIEQALARHGLPAAALAIEINEAVAMRDPDSSIRTMSALATIGVSLGIDNFGTGYSNFRSLQAMQITSLKIDREFIRACTSGSGDRSVVAAAISAAHALGITAIARGVESAEQATLLRELGCDHAQGNHFAPPATTLPAGT